METESLIKENERRKALRAAGAYTAELGNPSSPWRRKGPDGVYLPAAMLDDPDYKPWLAPLDRDMLRFRHDFEYWCLKCVRIMHKETHEIVEFRLNAAQRRLVEALEAQRRDGLPIRMIILKARQWGCSTLVQIYFAWIQIVHRRNWNSLICAHVKDTSSTIRGMYTCLLENYPVTYWPEESKPEFKPFERMTNIRVIPGRGCRLTIRSCENQDATRGQDYAMAHLSEVAFWRDSDHHSPLDLVRSVGSGILRRPLTVVVLESTANGVGNFFHREWLRAVEGKSDKTPFFVPWFEIEHNVEPVRSVAELWASLDAEERALWTANEQITLEAMAWYHRKRSEYADLRAMKAEFPSSPEEAFTTTGFNVFSSEAVERLRAGCSLGCETGYVRGSAAGLQTDISSPRFVPSTDGDTRVWRRPVAGHDYVAAVDVGGRSSGADWSVIAVFDTKGDGTDGRPELVAQWRGHIDHDLLAWKAAAMAAWYEDALLVFESNTLESAPDGHGKFLLDTLAMTYPNLYHRSGEGGGPMRVGFHTNRATKSAMIDNLIMMVREGLYTEHDHDACDELLQYETLPGGAYAARQGCHDDILMTRAIALYVIASDAAPCLVSQADADAMSWW